jgi:hypothetical protein
MRYANEFVTPNHPLETLADGSGGSHAEMA